MNDTGAVLIGKDAPLDAEMQPTPAAFYELGSTGLKTSGGWVQEDFSTKLRDLHDRVRVYTEMTTDPVVGAVLFAIEMFARQVEWPVEAGGSSSGDKEAASHLEKCKDSMSHTWQDFMTEALTMLPYGFAPFEICYETREDGRVYWKKIPIRAQETVDRWDFDDTGGLNGFWQMVINSDYDQDREEKFIPIRKMLLFRASTSKGNPEGKALALDTPVLTTDGWKTMKNINAGDRVFDECGRTKYVAAKSDVWRNRECYKVRFNSGETIIADAKHLWLAATANDRCLGKPHREWTTEEMYEAFCKNENVVFSVGEPSSVDQPKQWLPLDPYVLGYWLGDGDSNGGGFTVCEEDWPSLKENVEQAGFEIGPVNGRKSGGRMRVYAKGLRPVLRSVGVLKNKHIPESYLRGNYEQRLSLLQGLMDSDGSSPRGKRPSYFCNCNTRLIESAKELVSGLGSIPMTTVQKGTKSPNKEICGVRIKQSQDSHRVIFWANFPAHRLQRKLDAQTTDHVSIYMKRFFIRDIKPAEPRDTVCIEVEGPGHIFRCGRTLIPTHNSVLRAAYKPWYMKKKIEVTEAMGIERDLAGYPVLSVPGDIFAKNELATAMRQYAENMVTRIRRDQMEGAVLPPGWELQLLSAAGNRQFDTGAVINRYNVLIAQSVLADIILMGHANVGSYALAEIKRNILVEALKAWLDSIQDVLNRFAVPRLFAMNSFPGMTALPKFKHGPVSAIDPKTLADIIFRLSGVDALRPDDTMERHLRQMIGLPESDDKSRVEEERDRQAKEQQDLIDQQESLNRMVGGRGDNETRPSPS